MKRSLLAAVTLSVALTGIVSCTSDPQPEASAEPVERIEITVPNAPTDINLADWTVDGKVILPYTKYLEPLDQQRLAQETTEIFDRSVTECMSAAGFDFVPPEVPTPAPPAESRFYGITSSSLGPVISERSPDTVSMDSFPPDVRLALEGPPPEPVTEEDFANQGSTVPAPSGCMGVASNAVGISYDPTPSLNEMTSVMAQSDPGGQDEEAERDQALVALDGPWVECMSKAGYTFTTPADAPTAAGKSVSATMQALAPIAPGDSAKIDAVFAVEQPIFEADERCQKEVGSYELSHQIEIHRHLTVLAANLDLLNAARAEIAAFNGGG